MPKVIYAMERLGDFIIRKLMSSRELDTEIPSWRNDSVVVQIWKGKDKVAIVDSLKLTIDIMNRDAQTTLVDLAKQYEGEARVDGRDIEVTINCLYQHPNRIG